MAEKFTRKQFQAQYPDDAACLRAILERRYGAAEACPGCGVIGKLTRIEGRRAYACKEGCHTYPCAWTIFEHSSTPLTDWFYAMYLMTATRNGVSAKELQRQLGVTYKCAWRIGHQLRQLMSERAKAQNPGQMSGHVEIDETYVGGKLRKFHGHGKGEYLKNKATVFGMVQRDGDLRGHVVPNDQLATLWPIIRDNVAIGSTVSTDTHRTYRRLRVLGFNHGRLNHNINEWKRGIHHTNTIEGFWSHLKRGIKSTHASVSKKHLQKYVDEFAFRFNNREAPAEMFQRLLRQVSKAS
jgi:transposase-like protein